MDGMPLLIKRMWDTGRFSITRIAEITKVSVDVIGKIIGMVLDPVKRTESVPTDDTGSVKEYLDTESTWMKKYGRPGRF